MQTYTADIHQEGAHWIGEVREVPQAHTYGTTRQEVLERLNEALALVLDVPGENFAIIDEHAT